MRLNTFGQALLIIAILMGCANMVEPHALTALAQTIVTLIAFAIIVSRSHEAWSAGYRDALLDTAVTVNPEPVEFVSDAMLFKCGLDGCACEHDSRYKESQ